MDIIQALASLPPLLLYDGKHFQLNIIHNYGKALHIRYEPTAVWGDDDFMSELNYPFAYSTSDSLFLSGNLENEADARKAIALVFQFIADKQIKIVA